MIIKVYGKDLISTLSNVSGSKKLVNLSVIDNSLVVQSTEPIIMDEPIPITEVVDDTGESSITIEIDNSYNIIDENSSVEINIQKSYLMIDTVMYHCRFNSMPVSRFEISNIECSESYVAKSSSFEDIAYIEAPMLSISKSLKVSEPAVIVHDGFAYVILSSVACVIEVDLPDCVMSLKVAKAIYAVISRVGVSSVNLGIEKNRGSYCVIRFGKNQSVAYTIKYDNSITHKTIDKLIHSCSYFGSVNFESIKNSVRVISGTFKQIEVIVSVHKKGIYMVVRNGATSQLNVGVAPSDNEQILWRTNIVTVAALVRMFPNVNAVVKVGGRCLCCQSNRLQVLLSGVN